MKAAVLVVSDRAASGERPDASGPGLLDALTDLGFQATSAGAVADEREMIAARLRELATDHVLVLTTGGTGLGPRDVTPEATGDVVERLAPGFSEEMRRRGAETFPRAILSRGICGILGHCLIVNLPGSPKGALECLGFVGPVLSHGARVLAGGLRDCKDDPPPASPSGSRDA